MLTNNETSYGSVSRANHWLTAAVIIIVIASGLIMEELDQGEIRSTLITLHKSLGIGILLLVALRLVWLLISPNPSPLSDSSFERKMAGISKTILILGMIFLPLSGWVLSNSAGYEVSFFELYTLPTIIAENEMINELAEEVHELLANILMIVIGLHILATLKHHYIDEDDTLNRMLGRD